MMTKETSIGLRSICDLLDKHFVIPNYQRGYRWGKQEMYTLLDDIYDYAIRINKSRNGSDDLPQVGNFYCLQPIVVKKSSEKTYEVIDGQQRLTSIYLILTYLKDLRIENYPDYQNLYSITFDSRSDCKKFLKDELFATENVQYSNIDLYHMHICYKEIKRWFTDECPDEELMCKTLLEQSENVQVLWYEITGNDDPINIFSRLNIGKIPLTDAELIKALLLQEDCYGKEEKIRIRQQLFEIASAWDAIEVALQDSNFWYFLNGVQYTPSSRIEMLFTILADRWHSSLEKSNENSESQIKIPDKKGCQNFTYLIFDRYLTQKRKKDSDSSPFLAIKALWEDVQMLFDILCEWYNDKEIYHYIGFLLCSRKNKQTIKDFYQEYMAENTTKKDFIDVLRQSIKEIITVNTVKSICEYQYGENNNEIIDFLLLFNIDAVIKSSDPAARFPFGLFKQNNATSIEHIHPQNPPKILNDDSQDIDKTQHYKEILTDNKKYLEELLLDVKKTDSTESKHAEISKEQHDQRTTEIEGKIDKLQKKVDESLAKIDSSTFNKEEIKQVEALQLNILELYDEALSPELQMHCLPNLALLPQNLNSKLNNGFFFKKRKILQENKAYVPLCTERIFNKYYTESPSSMYLWNRADRRAYADALVKTYEEYTSDESSSSKESSNV